MGSHSWTVWNYVNHLLYLEYATVIHKEGMMKNRLKCSKCGREDIHFANLQCPNDSCKAILI